MAPAVRCRSDDAMQNDQAGFFGERTAAAYDELNGVAPPVMIDVLAELAGRRCRGRHG